VDLLAPLRALYKNSISVGVLARITDNARFSGIILIMLYWGPGSSFQKFYGNKELFHTSIRNHVIVYFEQKYHVNHAYLLHIFLNLALSSSVAKHKASTANFHY
jgi:hypothetical protein